MLNVEVEKVRDGDPTPPTFFERKIRRKAFEVFQCNGCADGHSLNDWLEAEGDIVLSPEAELIEREGNFQVRMAVRGFACKNIRVTAMPMVLFVEAESKHEHEKSEGDVYSCEFVQRQFFRRLDLPAAINVDKVSASLEHGVLQLTAPKKVYSANKVTA